jgi:hypothetical protein
MFKFLFSMYEDISLWKGIPKLLSRAPGVYPYINSVPSVLNISSYASYLWAVILCLFGILYSKEFFIGILGANICVVMICFVMLIIMRLYICLTSQSIALPSE